MKPLFNVVFYDGNNKLPDDKILYIVTKKGTFLRKDLGTIRSCTKVDSISFLKEIEPYAELKIPQISSEILAIALSFLKWIYDKYETEGGLLICYNSETREYILHAPEQEVSCGGVSWDNQKEIIPKSFIRMGTIHSHADMSAFHSGTDKSDEKSFDGLHITFGNLGGKLPTLVASVVVNGNRFPIKKENIRKYLNIEIIEEEKKIEEEKTPQSPIYEDYQSWLCDTKNRKVVSPDWKKWGSQKTKYSYTSYMNENEMKFQISNAKSVDFRFPNGWKSKPIKKEFASGVYRIVNGKITPVTGQNRIGFSGNNGYNKLWSDEELLNDYYESAYGKKEDINFNNNISKGEPFSSFDSNDSNELADLPHMECIECMYRIIAEEAMERGLIDIEEGSDGEPVGELPIDEDFDALYGKHIENESNDFDDVLFDKDGNIIDKNGKIIERLDGK